MSERVFLEDVGQPYSDNALGDARAWEVRDLGNDPTLPPLIYVVESEAGQRFLLGREISGRQKFNMIRYIAISTVELFFEQLREKDLSQYLIFRGAYPFDLQFAMGLAPPYDTKLLPTGWVKLQRALRSEGTDWEIHGQNLIGEYQGDSWLIPDATIASGSTIAHFLRNSFTQHLPKEVYLFTACGSLEGIQRIYQECRKKAVKLIPVLSQCIFEGSTSGNLPGLPLTNLSVMSPHSITTKSFYEKAFHRYQGTRMCCVGDIGEGLDDPVQYSIHTLWEMQVLGMDPKKENWDAWTVNVREKSFKERVSESNPGLLEYFQVLWK